MLREECDKLIDKTIKTGKKGKFIPDEVIDFIMRNR